MNLINFLVQAPSPEPVPVAFDWSSLIAPLLNAFGALAGGGWAGLIASIVGISAVMIGITLLIKKANGWIDKRDMEKLGGLIGKDSQSIKDQAKNNQNALNKAEDEALKKK
jgi:hypothetical protein